MPATAATTSPPTIEPTQIRARRRRGRFDELNDRRSRAQFRLPRDLVDAEILAIENLGVTFKCNTSLGTDMSLDVLRADNYKGFVVAVGTQAGNTATVTNRLVDAYPSGRVTFVLRTGEHRVTGGRLESQVLSDDGRSQVLSVRVDIPAKNFVEVTAECLSTPSEKAEI